ncbi:unnamed protein product [Leptosia nina]|uniref:Uncharacterized protein n=1 Tax=Leptosia nina TaxID=320188 RepID=A0AAV1J7L9_9NEOP
MAGLQRLLKRVAVIFLFAAANLFAATNGQLTFSSGWGKRSGDDDEITIHLDDQLQLPLNTGGRTASFVNE